VSIQLLIFIDEQFELPVEFKGEQVLLKASLIVTGYTHKFSVNINGQTVIFEPDEERNYLARLDYNNLNDGKNLDLELIREITIVIEELVK
jgi:hypothetical protein